MLQLVNMSFESRLGIEFLFVSLLIFIYSLEETILL